MYRIILVNLLFCVANSFIVNVPVNSYKRIYDSNIIKVYEPELIDKKDLNALIFYTGANSLIPGDIYSNFINTLNNYNFSVNVVTNNNIITNELLYDIRDEYKEIIPLTHSSGYVNAITTINKQKNIKKAIFLDPVDNSKLVNNDFLNFFSSNKNDLKYLEEVLILNAEKSYKGSIFPKLVVPFIPAFGLNIDNFEKNNPEEVVKKVVAEEYGHSDVLDSLWGDLMHATISKGTEDRDQKNLNSYLDWLANEIYNFVNKNSEEPVVTLVSTTSDYEE